MLPHRRWGPNPTAGACAVDGVSYIANNLSIR